MAALSQYPAAPRRGNVFQRSNCSPYITLCARYGISKHRNGPTPMYHIMVGHAGLTEPVSSPEATMYAHDVHEVHRRRQHLPSSLLHRPSFKCPSWADMGSHIEDHIHIGACPRSCSSDALASPILQEILRCTTAYLWTRGI